MHVFVHSASRAVTQALATIITAAGHQLAMNAETAELALVDHINPSTTALPQCATLYLNDATTTTNSTHEQLTCPLRLQTLIQKLQMYPHTQPIALGADWWLNLQTRSVTHPSSQTHPLTEKECALLAALVRAQPTALTREALLAQVWGVAGAIDTHTLETHIYRLRDKLTAINPTPGDIITDGGAYRWVV